MKEIHITFDSKEAEEKLLADEKFVKALTSLYTLTDNISSRVEAEVIPKIAEDKRRFTKEEEKYIWWGVRWAFKPENKNRIFNQKEFFDYIYYEMEV